MKLSVCTLLLATITALHADVIYSSAAAVTNSTTGATVAYTSAQINPTWDAALFPGAQSSWISFDAAGLFGCNAAHDQTVNKATTATFCGGMAAAQTVTFTESFNLSSLAGFYTFYILADDTASVTLNGHSVATITSTASTGPCATSGITCTTVSQFDVSSDLNVGANTLSIVVQQNRANSEFGVNFDMTQSPEPATFAMIGFALIGFGLFHRRKRTKTCDQ